MWKGEASNIGILSYFDELLSYVLQILEYHKKTPKSKIPVS